MPVFDIPFAQFTPDGGRLDNPGLLNADNVAPFGESGFTPISLVNRIPEDQGSGVFPVIVGATPEASVSKYAIGGAHVFLPSDETWYSVYSGTMSGISGETGCNRILVIQFDQDGTVNEAGVVYLGTTSDPAVQTEGWFFATYGNSIVAVAGHDLPPQIDIDATESLSIFEDLWSVSSSNEPYAKYVAVIGLRLLLGNIEEGGTVYPNRVWWSATDDIRYYGTAASDPDKRTGYQDLNDEYGPITGLVGGTDYAYVAKAECWYRMDFGGPFDFQFRPFAIGHGCRLPHSIVKFGEAIYFWGPYGPAVIRGTNDPEPLGLGIFHRTLKDGSWVQEQSLSPVAGCPPHRMIGFVDAENELIGWAYNAHNALEEDVDWLWLIDTVFLYNVRYGRGSVIHNLMHEDILSEAGDETGIDYDGVEPTVVADPEGTYPADWRPAWPIFVPRQPNLEGFALWAPLLRIHWWLATKGFESSGNNSMGWVIAYGDNTASPLARFRTGCIALDPEGGDAQVKRVRLHFSTNVGEEPPEYEVRLHTLSNPTRQPSDAIVADRPTDRGWVTFPTAPSAPYAQFDVRIKNPHAVGEIEKLEVEVEFSGRRR